MRRSAHFTFLLCFLFTTARAQMWNGADTLYGNEWIRYDQQYFKIMVAEDGIYRIPYEALQSSGLPASAIDGSQYQLWRLGEEQPLYVSQTGPLGPGGFLEFYGQKNRSELDRYLFKDPDNKMLNPWYSLVTDTTAYFLTWVESGETTLRYEEVENDLANLPAKEEWVWSEAERLFADTLSKEYIDGGGFGVFYSKYSGDGFASYQNVAHDFSVNCPGAYPAGPEGRLEVRMHSNANTAGHSLEVRIDGQLLAEESYSGAQLRAFQFPVAAAALGNAVNIKVNGLNNNDRYAVAGARLRYPRTPSFNGSSFGSFTLPAGSGVRYLELDGLGGNGPAVLLDRSNRQRLTLQPDGNLWKAKLPAAAGVRGLAVAGAFFTVSALAPASFADYKNTDADFLIITNPRLFDDGQGNNWVQEYADYRRSEAGGSHSVAVVEVQELYEQFAYGLNRHPLSIRNFAHYAAKNWPGLAYCFIIGKGQEYNVLRKPATLQAAVAEGRMLVPSFGYPASDNLLLSNNYTSVPVVPVGRLAATDGRKVKIYLDKVQAVEANRDNPQTIEGRAWMKRAIHLGGGGSPTEQTAIRSSLETMGRDLENNAFGASVRSFYKTTTDPIQTSLSEQIFNAINEGSSIIAFMGHSSPGTFDFNIDNPDNYSNYAKYPLMLSLGCYSGNIFTGGESIGERFTFYENRAAVAFGASRGVGYISSLAAFARSFYRYLGGDYYGQGIGDALKAAVADYDQNPFFPTATLVEQFTLHGDPSIRLHPAPGPDFVPDPASVRFEPRVVTAQQDSFRLTFDALNLGRNGQDTFTVEIRQQLPGGNTVEVVRDTVAAPAFRSAYSYRIPVRGKESVGLNTFFIRLDADSEVAELPVPAAELNNELVRSNGEPGAPLFIVDNTARPVYPPDFALVGETPITLKASTTDALAPERTYILEIDTTALFDSPLKRQTAITQRGGVIKWAPALPWQDSTAYFWRISPDSTEAGVGYTWEQSSFTYIDGSPEGWGQGGYWQFRENNFFQTEFPEGNRQLDFSSKKLEMTMSNRVYGIDPEQFPFFSYNTDGPAGSVRPWLFMSEGVSVIVGEPRSTSYWRNTSGYEYDSEDPPNQSTFSFNTTTAEGRQALIHFLTEVIPDDYYVFVFTVQSGINADFKPGEWAIDSVSYSNNLFQLLENEGAQIVRQLSIAGSIPYSIVYQKSRGVLEESIASDIYGSAIVNMQMPRYFTDGSMLSAIVGPANDWRTANLQIQMDDFVSGEDSVGFEILGLNHSLNITDTLYWVQSDVGSLDMSSVDAALYPYLQLKYFARDEQSRTLANLSNWSVLFDQVGDYALTPVKGEKIHKDTVQQGELLNVKLLVSSISGDKDSLKVKVYGIDLASQERILEVSGNVWVDGEEETVDFSLDTRELTPGKYLLVGQLNPDTAIAERYFFNNSLISELTVLGDQKAPILDVTFDGEHIFDGSIVSANSTITVTLWDENPYFPLEDTSLFEIVLRLPDGALQPVFFDAPNVNFIPAESGEKNKAVLTYHAAFEQDGEYMLEVKGRDLANNLAGAIKYMVRFRVISENTISNVLNYPNPFSTSTQFVYTLTGEPPAEFKIQVATVSGRIVREITQAEIGELKVGTHRTEYRWNGTDEYGDRLANGVYLYRIAANDSAGKPYKSYSELEDQGIGRYFANGWGKMVLLR
ncbi:MAG: hypothetical protein H6557_22360 [Lewinellaceae bacterium]|nr:hypothetical protein [Phaeodactylibacter sp.]MCB9039368.1 hypothetical protein [Lewinellaceae bacterium]